MSLQGEIQTMPLPDLFQWLEIVHKTGTLTIDSQKAQQQFIFNNGEIATALSSHYHSTDSEHSVRVIVRDTLQWEKGHFAFADNVIPGEVMGINLHISPLQVVLDTFREIDEKAEAERQAGENPSRPPGAGEEFHYAHGLRMSVVGQLLKGDFKVPLLPTIVNKVLEITQRDNYALRDLSEVIVTDPVISAQLLKHANSAFYSRGHNIESVALAIQHLGAQAVTNLVLTLSLQSVVTGRDIFLEDRKQIWQHSLACALLSRSISTIFRLDREQAFLCGLMIDFGKLILLSLIFELMQKKQEYQATPKNVIEDVIETYHPKVGGIVGARWKLPPAVLEAITYHHALSTASEFSPYVAVASLCDAILLARPEQSEENTMNQAVLETTWLDHPAARILGLADEQLQRILQLVPECQLYASQMAAG
jgi:HD-like signal output (HDOD) protein